MATVSEINPYPLPCTRVFVVLFKVKLLRFAVSQNVKNGHIFLQQRGEAIENLPGHRCSRLYWHVGGMEAKDPFDPSHGGIPLDLELPAKTIINLSTDREGSHDGNPSPSPLQQPTDYREIFTKRGEQLEPD